MNVKIAKPFFLILIVLAMTYVPFQAETMETPQHIVNDDNCCRDCCGTENTECPVCINTNPNVVFLLKAADFSQPSLTSASIKSTLDTLTDQEVIEVIPPPPASIL